MTPQFRRCLSSLYVRDSRVRAQPWIVEEFDLESSGVHVPDARNDMVRAFIDHPLKPQWLLSFDVDATFGAEILDQFMEVADADHPIVGALAFGVAPAKRDDGTEAFNTEMAVEYDLFPTIYYFDDDGNVAWFEDYPPDTLIPVHSTGCHAFIVHRSVLEDPRWTEDGHPQPWFRVAVRGGAVISEDQFFFVKAGALGYHTHVHTGIRTGHVKTWVADEDAYLRRRWNVRDADAARQIQTEAFERMVAQDNESQAG